MAARRILSLAAKSSPHPEYALGFDGNDYVTFPLLTDKTYDVTFAIWFKTTDSSKLTISECLWWIGSYGAGTGYGLFAGGNPAPRDVRFAVLAYSKWWRGWYPGWEWIVNAWQHVALIFIYESPTTIILKFYLNGLVKDTLTGLATPIVPTAGSLLGYDGPNRYLGRRSMPAVSSFLDEFRIWNRALTDDEIKSDMGAKTPVQDGLVLWLPMNEGKGDIVYDGSGYGNNGTIHGATWVVK